jgi:hypothetical protein
MVAAVRYRFWLCSRHLQHEHIMKSAQLGIHSKMATEVKQEIAHVLFIDMSVIRSFSLTSKVQPSTS